jgi:hypothetical protein
MGAHVHAWERRADADTNGETLKYRCACGRWGFGAFRQGRGLVIREHSVAISGHLERGPVDRTMGSHGRSPNVDSAYEPLRERDS